MIPKQSVLPPTTFPIAGDKDFERHYKASEWQYFYLTRNLKSIFESPSGHFRATVAFFDSDGYLIQLYGSQKNLAYIEADGIRPGTIWRREEIGANAVTNGLRYQITDVSIGEENEFPVLKKYALYYSHVHLRKSVQSDPSDNEPLPIGGIAVIVRSERADPDYLLTLNALVHDLEMTLHFNQTSMHLYEREKSGLLIVDSAMVPRQNTILFTNQMLFKALQIPERDLHYAPLEQFLTPRDNERLWEMVSRKEHVAEQAVTITIGGRAVPCLITCDVYRQPSINADGVILYITTPQIESRRIAKKMGNAAVLTFDNIVGRSSSIRSAIRKASLIAGTDSNVLILGESGVGKDVFAQAIHNASARRKGPFIAVNCGALPRELIASELFGYDSGAFTGAKKNGNLGKFELADGGTIFLDEIGELPMDLQATLLRVVEQKQLMRLGSNKLLDIDVKIISATNADIPGMIRQKKFRADLFYRLGTMKLLLPPLRARREDIIPLSEHFIRSVSERSGKTEVMKLSPEAAALLQSLPWDGNVRELQNLLESIVQLYPGEWILPEYIRENMILPSELFSEDSFSMPQTGPASPEDPPPTPAPASRPAPAEETGSSGSLIRRRRIITKERLLEALQACDNNRSRAADLLNVSRRTFYRYMERYGLAEEEES